jgi:predicted phosphoribosyltransferase
MEKFTDRQQAGQLLAEQLTSYTHRSDVIVLALPRGGVPVAYEIAKALSLPLDIFIVRKLGVPGHEELAMGAIASGGVQFFNEALIRQLHLSKQDIERIIQSEERELKRREWLYRGKRPFPTLSHKTILLVDDGIATGATMKTAIKALRKQNPSAIVVAVPVSPPDTSKEIETLVEKTICLLKPPFFDAVGNWYEHFSQTTDDEVIELLTQRYA